MANTITGKIHKIYPTERKEINGKVYHERILVIDNTRYDQYTGEPGFSSFPSFSINGDEKCRELDSFAEGEVVTVSFDIQGLKYNDKNTGEEKYFNKVRAYKIERVERYNKGNNQTTVTEKTGVDNHSQEEKDDFPV